MERMVTRITEQVKCAFASFFFLMVFGMNSWSATVSDDEVKTWARQFSKNILDEQELKRLEEEWELVVSREHDDYFSEIYGVQWNDLSIKFYSDGKPMFFYKDFHDSFTTPTLELDVRPTESMKIVADRIVSYSAGKEYEFIGSTLQEGAFLNSRL